MRLAVLSVLSILCFGAAAQATPPSVQLEELTWTEVRAAIQSGTTTIIVPAGGTEQSGPHIALGKHNVRARVLAGRIAAALGDTLVAPVLAYVPEGAISPPSGHMLFPGTISIPEAVFKNTLEAAGRSLRQAGFTHIVLVGDHGGYQSTLKQAAADLNKEWGAGSGVRALYIPDYYRAADVAYVRALRAKGLSDVQIGSHAGTADTSLTLAIDPSLVRSNHLSGDHGPAEGTNGDPGPSSAALGQLGVDLVVSQTVAAIRKARAEKR
ncbi:MAG TPA: creatininase family protein [Reyranella sp.]|nr:creatininase family protein [Reyranella sp.]